MARLSSSGRGAGGRCYSVVALLLALVILAASSEAFLLAPGGRSRSGSSSGARRITGLTRRASSVSRRDDRWMVDGQG